VNSTKNKITATVGIKPPLTVEKNQEQPIVAIVHISNLFL
jgi:hypothetical protein